MLEQIIDKLQDPIKKQGYYIAKCPAHDDQKQSLSLTERDGKILVKCHAGCDNMAVIEALKKMNAWPTNQAKKRISAVYDYKDQAGKLLYQSVRYEPKSFSQRKPDGRGGWEWSLKNTKTVPYNLPEVVAAKKGVCIVEGEKDADNLARLNITATTCPMGAGKWRESYNQYFKDKSVIIIPDNDNAGKAHALKIAKSLHGIAKNIKIVYLPVPEKKDISDWLDNYGGSKQKLISLINDTEPYNPAAEVVQIAPPTRGKSEFIDWVHARSNGNPKGTIENTKQLLEIYDIKLKYNVISKDIEIYIPGESYTLDNAKSCAIARIVSRASEHNLPVGNIPEFLHHIADFNKYNPVAEWIDSKRWDGKDRIKELTQTLNAVDPKMAHMLLNRWLISAIAAIYEPDGVSAQGVLVLQGEQYIGKTSWFWSLLGGHKEWGLEGHMLNPSDRDSVKPAISKWIVELGEIDATFRKSDVATLKAFLTKKNDELYLRYSRVSSTFPRRTVFFASVNPLEFLHDETGNRRYWTISCKGKINTEHMINMQQLWAQAKTKYDNKETWYPTEEEMKIINQSNKEYQSADPVEELILKHYDLNTERKERLTSTEVLLSIGYDRPTEKQSRNCSSILRKLLKENPMKTTNGRRVFNMPSPKYIIK